MSDRRSQTSMRFICSFEVRAATHVLAELGGQPWSDPQMSCRFTPPTATASGLRRRGRDNSRCGRSQPRIGDGHLRTGQPYQADALLSSAQGGVVLSWRGAPIGICRGALDETRTSKRLHQRDPVELGVGPNPTDQPGNGACPFVLRDSLLSPSE